MEFRQIVRITGGPVSPGRCGSQRFVSAPIFREDMKMVTCNIDAQHPGDHEMHCGGSISGEPPWHMVLSWPWEEAP